MFLVDSHCHIDNLNYQKIHRDIADVVFKANKCDVKLMLEVCTTLHGFYTAEAMIGDRNDILFSCGIHPLYINESYNLAELRHLAKKKHVVAIGETGLDYYYQQSNKNQQQTVFREHISVGHETNKPIIIHMRNATEDTLSILREEQASNFGGVFHCFTEDQATAKAILDMGFYISLSGIVTFCNAKELREVARYIPIDKLLIETDSPYLAPVPYRGKENQPAYLRDIAECVAKLKGVSLIQFATKTTENFFRLFNITK